MVWLVVLQVIALGILEGLTEFLPVSSTGHLILVVDILHVPLPEGRVFEVAIQLGAILAICWLYRLTLWSHVRHLPTEAASQRFALSIILAFLPAAILGAMFHSQIKEYLFSIPVVASMLVIGGFIILAVERMTLESRIDDPTKLPWKTALAVGFCQALAMIPGTSRSGATIIGGRLLGLSRTAAAEFSFFLAIPTMLGATVYDLYKNWESLSFDGLQLIAIGFVSAFLSALLVIKPFIGFISKHGFAPFGYYRIVIGSVILAGYFMHAS